MSIDNWIPGLDRVQRAHAHPLHVVHVHLTPDYILDRVMMDGREVHNVIGFNVEHFAGDPVGKVTLTFHADSTVIVPPRDGSLPPNVTLEHSPTTITLTRTE